MISARIYHLLQFFETLSNTSFVHFFMLHILTKPWFDSATFLSIWTWAIIFRVKRIVHNYDVSYLLYIKVDLYILICLSFMSLHSIISVDVFLEDENKSVYNLWEHPNINCQWNVYVENCLAIIRLKSSMKVQGRPKTENEGSLFRC